MNRPLIAVDIDDTLADSTNALRIEVNRRYGTDISPEAYLQEGEYRGYYTRVWALHGLTDLKLDDLDLQMAQDQAHVPLLPSAHFGIKQLAKQYEVVVITSRDPKWKAATEKWLAQNLPDIDIKLYFSGSHHAEPMTTKGQLCAELGAIYLIDDNVGHCESAVDEGVTPILFGQYGWHGTVPDSIVRCKDWPSVLDYFSSI